MQLYEKIYQKDGFPWKENGKTSKVYFSLQLLNIHSLLLKLIISLVAQFGLLAQIQMCVCVCVCVERENFDQKNTHGQAYI